MSEPVGRPTAALGGANPFQRAVAPALDVTVAPSVPAGHGRTRRFRLGATFVPDPEPELPAGTLLGAEERYRIVQLLGQGGMGRVYEARRERDGRAVAVKVLRTDKVGGHLDELVARFRQEAASASRVGHPGIIEMLGFEQTPDGRVLLAMELLRGRTLEDWMSSEGTLAEGLELVAQFCDALHAAHEAGIVHRDIKPENLFLHQSEDGTVTPKVLDFGLAKVEVPDYTQIETAAGTVLGTPYYLAPERALGQPLTRSADLYSMGVVLYELATGMVPFDANAFMVILEGHVRRIPLDLRQAAPERPIPDAVSDFVMALLAKNPADRPPTAAALSFQIRQLLRTDGAALASCPTGPRSTSTPDADTVGVLALAEGHTAAPGASATANAATLAPTAAGPSGSSPAVAQPLQPPRAPSSGRRLMLFVGLGVVVGVATVGVLTLVRPDPAPAAVAVPEADRAADPPAPPPEPPVAVADPGLQTPKPVESVVAVPKPRPEPEPARPSAKSSGGGTNGAAKKKRRKPQAKPPEAQPKAGTKPSLPEFKDDVYGD